MVLLRRAGEKERNVTVHSLVLEAFVGPRPDGMQCRHFPDRNPTNNRVSNLSWGTPLENANDRRVHGTIACGDRHSSRMHPESVARGVRHGSVTKPWRVPRGDRNGSRTKPHLLARGEDVAVSKLCPSAVVLMRYLHVCHGAIIPELSEYFGVTINAVWQVIRGKTWRHVAMQTHHGLHCNEPDWPRSPRGAKHGNAKLNEALVVEARTMFANGATRSQVHAFLGVSRGISNAILRGASWRHVPAHTDSTSNLDPRG
jgi:hypothetical protein